MTSKCSPAHREEEEQVYEHSSRAACSLDLSHHHHRTEVWAALQGLRPPLPPPPIQCTPPPPPPPTRHSPPPPILAHLLASIFRTLDFLQSLSLSHLELGWAPPLPHLSKFSLLYTFPGVRSSSRYPGPQTADRATRRGDIKTRRPAQRQVLRALADSQNRVGSQFCCLNCSFAHPRSPGQLQRLGGSAGLSSPPKPAPQCPDGKVQGFFWGLMKMF